MTGQDVVSTGNILFDPAVKLRGAELQSCTCRLELVAAFSTMVVLEPVIITPIIEHFMHWAIS